MTDAAPGGEALPNVPLRILWTGATVALLLSAFVWGNATGFIDSLTTGLATYDPDPAAAAWARILLYLGLACGVAAVAVEAVLVELRRLAAASRPALVSNEEIAPNEEPQAAS